MKITTIEEVTRTYCDVCGINITNQNQVGAGPTGSKIDYVVCMSSGFDIDLTQKKGVRINCEHLAKLYTAYPELANKAFETRENNG